MEISFFLSIQKQKFKFCAYETQVDNSTPVYYFYELSQGVYFYTPDEVKRTFVGKNLSNYYGSMRKKEGMKLLTSFHRTLRAVNYKSCLLYSSLLHMYQIASYKTVLIFVSNAIVY